MKEIGLYIHIPFCKSKCLYCDFTTMPYQDKRIDEYFKLLLTEIEMYKNKLEDCIIDTIYIGGGTPSYVDSKYIVEVNNIICKYFNISKDLEYTIEINPGTISYDKINDYKRIGINRTSIGVQSFNDDLLKSLGRSHNTNIVFNDLSMLRKAGFKNISFDLMMGLPNQTIDDIFYDIKNINILNPEHISWYSLIIEENTRFHKLCKEDKLSLPDEEKDREIYSVIISELEKFNLVQYEISNFSKKGYESKHNLKYWNVKEYLGIGIGASGYLEWHRYTNVNKYNEYKNLIHKGEKPLSNIEKLNTKDKIFEKIIMNMRLTKGVNINELKETFGYDIIKLNKNILENYMKLGFIEIINGNILFTQSGFNISNKFFVDINI
ncbi:radical SAM family heme chaperone HemW [Miniphocaeibacter massiliensis]|uniref:radical SAM family heme chaperone HemW n=1 Tax=Miniphocaeibacter massiliensis TaxID=2041841 RepID=UPI000C0815D3|nr:radical SAM family heme chaperone HemW [Miniphocaeibacter massiliensis]